MQHLVDIDEGHVVVLGAMAPQAVVVHVHLRVVLRHLPVQTQMCVPQQHLEVVAKSVACYACAYLSQDGRRLLRFKAYEVTRLRTAQAAAAGITV
jgi:hypothetical protein